MVDSISSTKGIRHTGSATARYGASPAQSLNAVAPSRPVAPVQSSSDAGRQEHDDRQQPEDHSHDHPQPSHGGADLRLEISEDETAGELVYRFVDVHTGQIVREWDAGEFGKLRDYVRDRKIRLIDTKA